LINQSFLFLIIFSLGISCVENAKNSQLEFTNNSAAIETATGVTLNFSDLGNSKLLLKAPKLVKLLSEDNHLIMECPVGLKLIFYDSLKNVESTLIADYGKMFSKEELLKVRGNVRFNNHNLDTLFAEELDIDFAKDSIYSEKLIIFSNTEGRISGTKLKANSNFTFFQLSNVSEGHVNYDMK